MRLRLIGTPDTCLSNRDLSQVGCWTAHAAFAPATLGENAQSFLLVDPSARRCIQMSQEGLTVGQLGVSGPCAVLRPAACAALAHQGYRLEPVVPVHRGKK